MRASDFSEASLVEVLSGQNAVICAIPAEALLDQLTIINAAARAGVWRYLPSEFADNLTNTNVFRASPLHRDVKARVLEHLKATGAETPGFTYTPIATGAFLEWVCRL